MQGEVLNKPVLHGSSSLIVVSSHTLHVAYIDFRLGSLSSNHFRSHIATTLT